MSRIHQAINRAHELDFLANRDLFINHIQPLSKLLAVLVYIIITLSFSNYDLTGILSMAILPILLFQIGNLSLKQCIYQSRYILLVCSFVGIVNAFFDQKILLTISTFAISGGVLSFFVLLFKNGFVFAFFFCFVLLFKEIFCFEMVYFLIATTSMERLCVALQKLYIPKILITTILLIYRYIVLLLQEVNRISIAYLLRAPNQKGIQYKAWGSFVGQLLLRSMDRAMNVYDSMLLRGFNGCFYDDFEKYKSGIAFFICVIIYCILCRLFPLFEMFGKVF